VIAELSGLREETLVRWKKGNGNPRISELEALAEALRVSVVYLISDERPDEHPTYPPTAADSRNVERLLREGERLAADLSAAVTRLRPKK
jgi:transcriptional regulator with XRE-family HTH domain